MYLLLGQMCVLSKCFDDDDLEINVVKATIGQVDEVSLVRAVRVSPESILASSLVELLNYIPSELYICQ